MNNGTVFVKRNGATVTSYKDTKTFVILTISFDKSSSCPNTLVAINRVKREEVNGQRQALLMCQFSFSFQHGTNFFPKKCLLVQMYYINTIHQGNYKNKLHFLLRQQRSKT